MQEAAALLNGRGDRGARQRGSTETHQGGSATFKARVAGGASQLSGRPSFPVLDGPQRLTSLYQAISRRADFAPCVYANAPFGQSRTWPRSPHLRRPPNRNIRHLGAPEKRYPNHQLMHQVMDWFVRQPPSKPIVPLFRARMRLVARPRAARSLAESSAPREPASGYGACRDLRPRASA